ncbi:MAG: sulfatase family protein [Candidatus Binatia bacterium]
MISVAGVGYWALTGAAHRTAPARRLPNLLLISIDTLRADHVSAYGYDRPTTPAIDALAARGVTFGQAYSHSPKTAISHMSIMTGLLPEAHGVEQWQSNGAERLSDDIPTLASLLKPHGYATFAITGGGHVRGELGFDQGMDSFEFIDSVVDSFATLGDRIVRHVTTQPAVPFFAFVHTYAVHDPYVPPPPYRTLFTDPAYAGRIVSSSEALSVAAGSEWKSQHELYWRRVDARDPHDVRQLEALYDGAVRMTDDQIGKVLDRLREAGITDDTLIIVLSDHGEEFLDHGMFQHEQVYEELLHVPFIMVFPRAHGGGHNGQRVAAVVRMIDVLPTVLDYFGLPRPEHVQGVSLLPMLADGPAPPVEVMSSWREGGLQSLRVDDVKVVRRQSDVGAVEWELYALGEDPHEQHNRSRIDPQTSQRMAQQLDRVAAAARAFRATRGRGPAVAPNQDTLERLRALGY